MVEDKRVQENLAEKGIVQQGASDILTISEYHPEVLNNAVRLFSRVFQNTGEGRFCEAAWALMHGTLPNIMNFPGSGYRSRGSVKADEHCYGLAVDAQVLFRSVGRSDWRENTEHQFAIARLAVASELFTRVGIYPTQNTMHFGLWDAETIRACNATPYWVRWPVQRPGGGVKEYHGFWTLDDARAFALMKIAEGDP